MNLSDPEFYNEQAKQLWETGRRGEAIRAWKKALDSNPGHVEALTSLAWALEQQDYEEAIELARRAVERLPEDPAGRRVLGELLFCQGRYAEAAEQYLSGLDLNGGRDELVAGCLCRNLADAYYMLGRFREAVREYEAALAAGADQAYCHLWLGWAKQQLGDRGGAISDFTLVCELAPRWHEAFYAAGQLHCAQGKYVQARDHLERALSLYPAEDEEGRAAATCELGNAIRGLGDLLRAVDLYQEALSLDPTHPVARFNLGLAHNELGDHEAALAAFSVIAQLDSGDADVHVERGHAYLELGRHDEAIEAYRAALAIQPENSEAFSGLGLTYYGLGVYDTSVEHYLCAVKIEPGDPWPRYNLALALDAAGRHAEADGMMEQAWQSSQEDGEACVAIARAVTSQGRNSELAACAARRACCLDPGNPDGRDALAMALLSAGKHDAALIEAEKAVRMMPEASEYRYDLGLIQEALGNLAAARTSFARALDLSPDFDEAQEALRRLEHSL
jgi:tetratricopeptide (TPR) repeat protein